MDADWTIDRKDLIRLNSRATTRSETLTRISVRYIDAIDGSQQEVRADAPAEGHGLAEKVIKVIEPMTREVAEKLARAAVVLGRSPIKRYWITIDGSRLLQHRTGRRDRPGTSLRETPCCSLLRTRTVCFTSSTPAETARASCIWRLLTRICPSDSTMSSG